MDRAVQGADLEFEEGVRRAFRRMQPIEPIGIVVKKSESAMTMSTSPFARRKRQAELIIRPGALTTESINLDARKRHAAHPFAILALQSLARR